MVRRHTISSLTMMTLHQKYLSLMNAASAAGAPFKLLRACFCLLSVSRAIDADCAVRLSKYSLSEGKFVLLFFLAQSADGIAPTELAKVAGVTKATVTGLSEGLVKIGLVKRVGADSDRRSFKLELTPKGKRVTEQVVREHGIWICSLFERLKSTDLEQFESLLSSVWLQTDEGKLSSHDLVTINKKNMREKNAKNPRKI